jgi:hypothetical protein
MGADGRKTILLLLMAILSVWIAFAGNKGKGKGKHGDDESKNVNVNIGIFIDRDRDLIRDYYSRYREGDNRGLPPGLAKRGGDLPPGLEKHLQRDGHLPPGLEKKIHPFPVEMEHRMAPLKPGLIRGIIGGHAVIMDKKTSVILDVFSVF